MRLTSIISRGHSLPFQRRPWHALLVTSVLLAGCASAPSQDSVAGPEERETSVDDPAGVSTAESITLMPLTEPLSTIRPDRAPPVTLQELPLDTVRPVHELYDYLPADLQRGEHELLRATPRTVTGYTLTLAGIFYLRQNFDEAAQLLSLLDPENLDPGETARYTSLVARTELALNRPENALAWLESEQFGPSIQRLSFSEQMTLEKVRINALSLTGEPVKAARHRIDLAGSLMQNESADRANREAIWLALTRLSDSAIMDELARAENPELAGWLELVQAYRTSTGPGLADALTRWSQRHSRHAARSEWPFAIQRALRVGAQQPHRVALMLPRSGPLERRGQAVQDGFMAAYYEAKNQGFAVPELMFLDENSGDPRQLVANAAARGVDWVVGPLSQNATFRLEAVRNPGTQVLALNRTDRSVLENPDIIQFGLSPVDQARQVAVQAWRSGYRRAAILYGHTRRHEEAARAFRNRWQSLGGRVVSERTIPAEDNGRQYLAEVKALLSIDSSEQRAIEMRRLLGSELRTEPRRRQDIEVVFMPVNATQARTLRPLLNFQFAGDLPVLSTTALVDPGTSNRNNDLQGIMVLETPWRLRPSELRAALRSTLGEFRAAQDRYYGLGIDSFRALNHLAVWNVQPDLPLAGVTGTMTLSATNQVRRKLLWAHFDKGKLVPLEPQR